MSFLPHHEMASPGRPEPPPDSNEGNTGALYSNPGVARTVRDVSEEIRSHRRIILFTGETFSGKILIVCFAMETLEGDVRPVLLTGSNRVLEEFRRFVCQEVGLDGSGTELWRAAGVCDYRAPGGAMDGDFDR